MPTCPDAVKRLIERFDQQSDQVRSSDYNETQLRIDFVNPMFATLGWDMDNTQGFAEQYREVVHEDRVKVAGSAKAPDYSFRIGGVANCVQADETLNPRLHQTLFPVILFCESILRYELSEYSNPQR